MANDEDELSEILEAVSVIMDTYDIDDTDNEVEKVTQVGEAIATFMSKYRWMQWTKFPNIFNKCRSDVALMQAIDDFWGWAEDINIVFAIKHLDNSVELKDEENA